MNLYLQRLPSIGSDSPTGLSMKMTDAEGRVVGYVTAAVADHLIRSGVAMDLS